MAHKLYRRQERNEITGRGVEASVVCAPRGFAEREVCAAFRHLPGAGILCNGSKCRIQPTLDIHRLAWHLHVGRRGGKASEKHGDARSVADVGVGEPADG